MKKSESKKAWLRIGELAQLASVSPDTLRHYERKGLLKPSRLPSGYRVYTQHAIDRVILIRNALAVGFGLDELAHILKIRDSGGKPCSQVRSMVVTKLSDLETLLYEMTMMRDELCKLLKDWNTRLESVEPDQPARLLESLATTNIGRFQIFRSVKVPLHNRKLPKEKK